MNREVPPLPQLGGGAGHLGLSVQPEVTWPPHLFDTHALRPERSKWLLIQHVVF